MRVIDKKKVKAVIEAQPVDASYDEILHELALEQLVERDLVGGRVGRVISNEEIGQR